MNVVSLFSGAGGLDLGFIQAGHTIVWANDIYGDAVETYKLNIGNHIVCDDIANVHTDTIPSADIVIGGFPCQGFSVANVKRHEKDERNKLYLQLVRVIREKKPKFFLAENVKGLTTFCEGKVFNMILSDFKALGYNVVYKVLNTADFGVPQTRQRVIIVGTREDLGFSYEFPTPQFSKNGIGSTSKWVSVGEALANIPDPDTDNDLPNHIYSKYKLNFNGYIGHRPLDPNKPAPTVTARGDDRGGVVILPHPNGIRRMSCRELATVQSFPLDYNFVGGISSICRQIGNAVPPLFARQLASVFNTYENNI